MTPGLGAFRVGPSTSEPRDSADCTVYDLHPAMGHRRVSEFLEVAERVLAKEQRPMSAKQLVDTALELKLFSDKIAGRTPHQTMKAKLAVDIRRRGARSAFVRTRAGRFFLRRLIEDPATIYEAKPLRPPPPRERVLVFPSLWLEETNRFQGILRKHSRLYRSLLASGVLDHIDRKDAELTEDVKQVITYVMVTRRNRVLAFKRGQYSRTEDFLKGSHCIAFGGHVAQSDLTLFSGSDYGIRNCAVRELLEELKLPRRDQIRLANGEGLSVRGLLNDDSSAAGRRHFAVLFQYEASSDPDWEEPEANEKSVTRLRWLDPNESPHSLFEFEYWSQLCLLEFYQRAELTQPTYSLKRVSALRPPNVLAILGPIGSGKSEATKVLTSEFGYTEVNSGVALADVLGIPPVPTTSRDEFQAAAWAFIRRPDGTRRLAEALARLITAADSDRVLIDGIRQRETLTALRRELGGRRVGAVYVHTPANVAYDFFRRRSATNSDIHQFLRVRSAPVEQAVERLIDEADAVLYNWRGRDPYKAAIRRLMREARVGPVRGRRSRR